MEVSKRFHYSAEHEPDSIRNLGNQEKVTRPIRMSEVIVSKPHT